MLDATEALARLRELHAVLLAAGGDDVAAIRRTVAGLTEVVAGYLRYTTSAEDL